MDSSNGIKPTASITIDEKGITVTVSATVPIPRDGWNTETAARWFVAACTDSCLSLAQEMLVGENPLIAAPTVPEAVVPTVPQPETEETVTIPEDKEEAALAIPEAPIVRRRPGRPPRRQPETNAETTEAPTRRRPGRPKGSKNKPKAAALDAAAPVVRTPLVYGDPEGGTVSRPFPSMPSKPEEELDEPHPLELNHTLTRTGNGHQPYGNDRRAITGEEFDRDRRRILEVIARAERSVSLAEIKSVTGINEYRVKKALARLLEEQQLAEEAMAVGGRQGTVPAYSIR